MPLYAALCNGSVEETEDHSKMWFLEACVSIYQEWDALPHHGHNPSTMRP